MDICLHNYLVCEPVRRKHKHSLMSNLSSVILKSYLFAGYAPENAPSPPSRLIYLPMLMLSLDLSRLYFILLFWNQTLTCRSERSNSFASFILFRPTTYISTQKSSSNRSSCVGVKDVRLRLGLGPPLCWECDLGTRRDVAIAISKESTSLPNFHKTRFLTFGACGNQALKVTLIY